ncbi:hypothetical protein GPECTOR_8g196 [Gonium pectorale]|uniref:RanBP2-type domain-containing protein n=1 Tax=Gonium pectorale TaxID=33097 RepID=A0A150GTY1_GONPE|nr:hypothetical protein GPECTOR_8g196 [Gonium pectorale]|eukprot:KXZ52810.1 hypothetical protein GPECTOR_8g196 [Gonium pectorale]
MAEPLSAACASALRRAVGLLLFVRLIAASPNEPQKRNLVIYSFAPTDPQFVRNLEYFVREAITGDTISDYVIIVQESTELHEVVLPKLPHNARYVRHTNRCYDWGSYGWLLITGRVDPKRYRYFFFINCSVRGPFLPAYARGNVHWTVPFTSRLVGDVKLVGPTVSCEGSPLNGDFRGKWRYNPHVQSYVVATDQVGLQVLLDDGRVFHCHNSRWNTIYYSELGSSTAILKAGYNLNCLMTKYQGLDWRDKANWACNGRLSPQSELTYDGLSLDPMEVMFVKVKQALLLRNISYALKADKYDKWQERRPASASVLLANAYGDDEFNFKASRILVAKARGSKCFDSEYYLSQNPDLALASSSAAWKHYTFFGQFERRSHRFTCPMDYSKYIKMALCGFTHPVLESGGGGRNASRFNNFNALKRHVESTFNQFFCDVCVKGRKVFVSEQLLYSKEGLRRHQDTGDESGPLAESGFKGHPACKFCRTRFYDSNELYRHMEGSHEHCFLCRRAAPDKYVYYRHYKRKFVVFSSDYELKAHFASEHGDEMKMTGAQRRQALTIPLQLQYRSRDDEETEPGPSARLERAAVVIGGGHNIGSRAARGRRGAGSAASGSGMHHSRSEPQFVQPDTSAEVSSVTFTAEDFPAPGSSAASGPAGALGRWAAFAGAQGGAGGLNTEDFPALPSLSKNQRRRIKEQQRSLAERLSAAAQPPRVLNRATAAAGPGPSSSFDAPSPAPLMADDFPSLPPGSKPSAKIRAGQGKGVKVISANKPASTKSAAVASLAAAGAAQGSAAGEGRQVASGSSAPGGVSNSLKAANKALVERIKRQLSGTAFDTFRQQSLSFMRGELAANEYHDYMVSLGLLSLVAELVSLCPDAAKRRLLLDVHRGFICSPAAQDPGLVGAGWMPPEVAVAKANRVAQHSAWGCPRCSLCNAPDDGRCESCGTLRPNDEQLAAASALDVSAIRAAQPALSSLVAKAAPTVPALAVASASGRAAAAPPPPPPQAPPAADDFPSLPSGSGRGPRAPPPPAGGFMDDLARADSGGGDDLAAASSAGGKGKKGKGTKITIGLPTSGGGGSRPHPQNSWTQPGFKAKVANQWNAQGGNKLAKMHGAINEAWDL